MSTRPVIVVGGGLAGITAAMDLAGAGRPVLLLEARPRLGGRAASGRRDGRPVDTGVHVILRCYDQYRDLLRRLGIEHLVPLQDRLDLAALLPDGRVAHLRRARRGPPPLHLLPALLRYAALPPSSRVAALRGAAALRHVEPDDPAADLESFGTWLDRHGQPEPATERLWGLLTTAALNLRPAEASLALATRVFRTGLIDGVGNGDIGVPVVPLGVLHEEPPRRALLESGSRIRLGCKAVHIGRNAAGLFVDVRDHIHNASRLRAEALVVALPHEQAAALVPTEAAPGARDWSALGHSAIVNVHLVLDRPVLPVPFAAVPGSAIQWVFDRTAASGRTEGTEQYLVSSVSAADAVIRTRAEELITTHLAELRRHLPVARRATVVDAFVTREPHATFRQRPGTARWRPGPATLWPDLTLAGAWTLAGWPDTLEAAVRSGHAAAAPLLARPVPGGSASAATSLMTTNAARHGVASHQPMHEMEVAP